MRVDFSLTTPNANDLKIHCVTSRRVHDGDYWPFIGRTWMRIEWRAPLYNGREPSLDSVSIRP